MPTKGRNAAPFLAAIATSVVVGLLAALIVAVQPPAPELSAARPAAPPKSCEEAGITPGSGRSGTCLANDTLLTVAVGGQPLVLPDRTVQVMSTQLVEAATPEGRARDRARLEIGMRIENTSSRPIVANRDGSALYLSVAGHTVHADPNADARADALRRQRPIAAGQETEGTLRFELAGAATRAVRDTGRADLGVLGSRDDRKGVIRLRVP